jgi:hypothetical protein
MSKRHVVDLPQVPGIDLDYRPRSYFWASDLNVPLTSSIAGKTRREIFRALIEGDSPVPDGLAAAVLDEETRAAWGRIHPSNMGGEYLPPLRKGEVEIARISLESTTADQISVRARRVRERIRYRIVDEYMETSTYVCHPASSVSPLSLGELIALMETADEGGSIIFPILEMNMGGGSTPAALGAFITVTSDFYADLDPYYRALTDAWLEERAQEHSWLDHQARLYEGDSGER